MGGKNTFKHNLITDTQKGWAGAGARGGYYIPKILRA